MKKLLSILLALAAATGAVACSGGGADKNKENETPVSEFVKLEEFDSYATISKIYTFTSLADASLCTDKEYVSSGEGSLRIELNDPDVYAGQMRSTSLYVPTSGNVGNYSDFSYVDQISLDVYGYSGENVSLEIQPLVRGKTSAVGPSKIYEIENGKWQTLTMSVNRTALASCVNISAITHVSLNVGGKDAIVYVDNLRLHKSSSDYVPAEIVLGDHEICDFEQAYQSFSYSVSMVGGKVAATSINDDPLFTTSGMRSLKVVSPAMETNSWYELGFSQRLMEAAKVSSYPATAYVAFDVYKDFDAMWWCTVRVRCNETNAYKNISINVPAGKGWHTIAISMSNAPNNMNYISYNWQTKSGLPGGGATETTFYLDNFRMLDSLDGLTGSYAAY